MKEPRPSVASLQKKDGAFRGLSLFDLRGRDEIADDPCIFVPLLGIDLARIRSQLLHAVAALDEDDIPTVDKVEFRHLALGYVLVVIEQGLFEPIGELEGSHDSQHRACKRE